MIDAKVAAALRECEEACPCRIGAAFCSICLEPMTKNMTIKRPCEPDCLWSGHAAIARYGDLREEAGRLEQAELTVTLGSKIPEHYEAIFLIDAIRKERDRLRREIDQAK